MGALERYAVRGLLLVLAAVALAACGTPAVEPVLNGHPSLSLNAPLTTVACTPDGTCLAVGVAVDAPSPLAAAQFRVGAGTWQTLETPDATDVTLTAAACARTSCWLGGTQQGTALVWSFNALNQTLTTVPSAASWGSAITAVACDATACGATVTTPTGSSLVFPGSTTATPLALGTAPVTALTCDLGQCTMATSANGRARLWRTAASGPLRRVGPTLSGTVTSLECDTSHCLALDTTATGATLLQSAPRRWRTSTVPFVGASLACTSLTRCVVVGATPAGNAALAWWHDGWQPVRLRFTPSPVTAVSCGQHWCAAVADTTVLNLRH